MDLTFKLKDADGGEHNYVVDPHGVEDGETIVWILVAAGAEPLAAAVSGILELPGTIDEIMNMPKEELLAAGLDFDAIGRSLRASVMSANMKQLRKLLLAHTFRDGEPMADPIKLNDAYQRNYFEMGRALWEVIRINRFFPGLSTD